MVRILAIGLVEMGFGLWAGSAVALDPAHEVSQYGHTAWRTSNGFTADVVGSIAQTTDGYLWLGTSSGVLRFDGVRTSELRPPGNTPLPDERVRELLGARDGSLWIATLRGLAKWKDGRLEVPAAFKRKSISVMEEEQDGTLWLGGTDENRAFLCSLRGTVSECHGDDGKLGTGILALALDTSGALWVAGTDQVWKWKPGPIKSFALPSPIRSLRAMTALPDGGVLVATERGVVKIADGRVELLPIARPDGKRFNRVMVDRDGAVWLASLDHGLLHWRKGGNDTFTESNGLSGDYVLALFEDREGSVWVGTSRGLDRFRPIAAATYSNTHGIEGRVYSVLPGRDGTVWASSSSALYRVDRGKVTNVAPLRTATLFQDRRGRTWVASESELGYVEGGRYVAARGVPSGYVDSLAEDARGNIWIAYRDAGLVRLSPDGKTEQRPWLDLGNRGRVSVIVIDPRDDSLWLGLWSGAILNMLDWKPRTFLSRRDLGSSRAIGHLRIEPDGTLWAASRAGLHRIAGGRVTLLDTTSGLTCNPTFWTMVDDRSWWIYTRCGLIEVARAEVDAWVSATQRGERRMVKARVLDHGDGVRMRGSTSIDEPHITLVRIPTPRAGLAADGRIWLATEDGVAVVDPTRVPFNSIPPPVHVEQIVVDGKSFETRGPIHLPPLPRDLEVGYTGLSLANPERVQFRYKLEGRDEEWQNAGDRRRAFYTDLPPGAYRFRVIAANDSGVWNEQGASLEFSIEAAWWQTNVFRLSCIAALVLVLFGLYRLRLASLARHFNRTLDARVSERLRISRDLHDTLLQSFQGLLLRFQAALQLWPSGEARQVLEKTIDQAADAISEGRDAVQGLRESARESHDLAEAIRALGQALAAEHGGRQTINLRVEVQGTARALHPIVRDEIFRIAAEALRNAFRHAQARQVEVEIRYDARQLRVRMRDDGKGMDREVLARGEREGHFGLSGMHERAKLIDGKLVVWSAEDTGTEVELIVPASVAYADQPAAGAVSHAPAKLHDGP